MLDGQRRPQGFEFDFAQRISVDGETVWDSCSTILARGQKKGTGADPEGALAASARPVSVRHAGRPVQRRGTALRSISMQTSLAAMPFRKLTLASLVNMPIANAALTKLVHTTPPSGH